MKQDSNKYIYDLAKRYRYGLLTKSDIELLSKMDDDDIFYKRLSEEMDDVWDELKPEVQSLNEKTKNTSSVKKFKIYPLYLTIASMVAVVVVVFIAFLVNTKLVETTGDKSSVFEFAQELNKNGGYIATESQLILSKEDTIVLDKVRSESLISYEGNSVVVEGKKIDRVSEAEQFNQLLTGQGKRSQLTFEDGTKIWANSATRVIYPDKFADDVREIYIEGEIYIEVSKDVNRQFKVRTKDFSVQVYGTKFNVSSYANSPKSEILLVEGSVSVQREKSNSLPIMMHPNELIELGADGEKLSIVDPTNYISWTKGLYDIDRETLGAVTAFLSQYYGVNIQCAEEIVNLRCSGKIDLKGDIDGIFKILFASDKIKYKKEGGNYYISQK